jgi:hypothetical protein
MARDVTAAELLDELGAMQRRALTAEDEATRLRGAATSTIEAVRRLFNHLANGDYDGQVSMGFAATFDQHLDAMLEEARDREQQPPAAGLAQTVEQLDPAAVDAALRQVIEHADYDLLKSLEGDESGVDEFPAYADRFITEYRKVIES